MLKASNVKWNRMPAYGVFHPCLKAVELGRPAAQPAWSAPTRPGRCTETWGPGPSSARPHLDTPAVWNWSVRWTLESGPFLSRRIGATSCAAGMVCSHPPRQMYRDLGPWTIFGPSSLGHSYREELTSERNFGALDHLQPVLTYSLLHRGRDQWDALGPWTIAGRPIVLYFSTGEQ